MHLSSDNGNRGKGIVLKYILEIIKKEHSDIKSLISHTTYGEKPNIIKLEINKDIYSKKIKLFYYDDYLEIVNDFINDKNGYTCNNYNGNWMIDSDYFTSNCKNKIEIFIKNKIYKLNSFFEKIENLISLDLTSLDTSNANDFNHMFSECKNLEEIKGIEKFNTCKVVNMSYMFYNCYNLKYLDLSNFDTSNVNDLNHMFSGCFNLREIKGINNFNTNKVINMGSMFDKCNKLKYLDLSNFDTSNVNNMGYMFNECIKLKYLDISNFNLTPKININNMFKDCNELENLNILNFFEGKNELGEKNEAFPTFTINNKFKITINKSW